MRNLILCNCQYYITHHLVSDFKIGEKVFLKSNPEIPLTVIRVRSNKVECSYRVDRFKRKRHLFSPETIIQYELDYKYSLT